MSLSEEELSRRRARYQSDDEWNARWPRWDEMDETGKGVTLMFALFLFIVLGLMFSG